MNFCYKFTIKGNPAIKKNSRNIARNTRTGRMFPIKSARLQVAESNAYADLMEQKNRGMHLPICVPVQVCFTFYRATKHRTDLSNLYEAAQDALQAAGIIEDDYLIESHDGSRRLYDAKNPRTEIIITPFAE